MFGYVITIKNIKMKGQNLKSEKQGSEDTTKVAESNNIKLYFHQTSGGAKYLMDTFIQCDNGHREGTINDKTKYVIRIDGDIKKDAEIISCHLNNNK